MTTYHTFPGIAKWARVHTPNKFNNYQLSLYVDTATRKAVKASGYRGKLNEDDDGFYYNFRRPHTKVFKGKEEVLGPPTITGPDGKPLTDFIGNGSEVEVVVEIYEFNSPQHGSGKGSRIKEVKVTKLVPYVKQSEETAEEEEEVVESKAKPKAKAAREDIPF